MEIGIYESLGSFWESTQDFVASHFGVQFVVASLKKDLFPFMPARMEVLCNETHKHHDDHRHRI